MIKKICIVNDAGRPQYAGPVRDTESRKKVLESWGYEVLLIEPIQFKTIKLPKYPEIEVPINPWKAIKMLEDFNPDAIHIVSEGTLGLTIRNYCVKKGYKFTTAYHTKFPEFIQKFTGLPAKWFYPAYRWFHKHSAIVQTPSENIKQSILKKGFKNIVVCPGGVDTEQFSPKKKKHFKGMPQPIWLNVGRVSPEKNLEAFLDLDLPGSKIIVGDGPARKKLEDKYPDAVFMGKAFGKLLSEYYSSADVFVFPSKEDTFGLVILESLASGVPVAAYPVTGPIDILTDLAVGSMNTDLKQAALDCVKLNKYDCASFAQSYDWKIVTKKFLDSLVHK